MDDALAVSGRQAVGNSYTVFNGLPPGNWRTADTLPKGLTLQQFHHDIGSPPLSLPRRAGICDLGKGGCRGVGTHIVDGQDVRMGKRRDSFRLTLKPGQRTGVPSKLFGQDLDGHLPIQPSVLRPIDLPHPACTKRFDDFIRAKLPAS